MMTEFNADEVLEMSIRIESNGAAFYQKAASLQSDVETKKFLEKLAAMEQGHKRIFSEMRKTLTENTKGGKVFDPQNELSLYLSSLADTLGGEGKPSAADALTGKETLEDILNTAIGLEKDSILFYIGLKDMVPPKYGQDKIDHIIKEERQHVAQLKGILANVIIR
jgi:rubrerythrin